MTACRDAFCPRAEREIACAQKIIDNKDAEIERLKAANVKVLEALKAAREVVVRIHRIPTSLSPYPERTNTDDLATKPTCHLDRANAYDILHGAIALLEGKEAEHDADSSGKS